MSTQLNIDTDELTKVFELWYTDFIEDREKFKYDEDIDAKKYGELSSGHFLKYLTKIKGE